MTFDPIVDPEADMPDTRFNDGKTDRQGRFWSGSMFEAEGKTPAKIAALYRLDPDLTVHRMVEGIGCSNGLAWSPDSRTMYYTDSHTSLVWAWDFEPASGDIANRRVFLDLSAEGYIVDGATVDEAGNYWLTVPFKGKVLAYDPKGKLITTIDMPTDLPTCCEFGGENLDTLYVTSATLRRSPETLTGPAAGRRPLRHHRAWRARPAAGAVPGLAVQARVTRTVASGRSNTSGFSLRPRPAPGSGVTLPFSTLGKTSTTSVYQPVK